MSAWKQLSCIVRVRTLLTLIFLFLAVAEVLNVLQSFQDERAGVLTESTFKNMLGASIGHMLITVALILGAWFRQRGMRGFLMAWLAFSVVVASIVISSRVYDGKEFPLPFFIADALHLAAWLIVVYSRDIHYYYSYNYDDRPPDLPL